MSISTTIFPGRYVQGKGVIAQLGEEAARLGDKALIIGDEFVLNNILVNVKQFIEQSINIHVERFGGECSDEEIDRLSDICRANQCNVIIGIGGGKTFDTAKAIAHNLNLPVIIAPTIASTDAPCSALSVIYTKEGQFKRYLVLRRNPDVVLVDTGIIANAPVRFLVSGMGDALSTYFEAESCRLKYAANMTGKVGSMTAYALAGLCYETLINYGAMAKISCEAKTVTPALERVVEANTLLSGIGFESGGLAAAHAIHDGLTVLEQTHKYYHGEKVAYGTLASLFLTDKSADVIDEVYSFCESVGLPTTLSDIGLGKASDEELMKVAESACAEGETIYNEPIPISPEVVLSALKAADAYGKKRKQHKRGIEA
ncbi:glycerol dehydrogenase [Caldanaerobius polysaccharolyticus]|uniref:glycerol dehydrogenase n=1 Tax=Caldanaerobius polysaccharolyticus TaxID=44256 RepID=UPI00047CE804|nr:glycerol dehydrogenase [Caldanaerobius polysaccharolyticus]